LKKVGQELAWKMMGQELARKIGQEPAWKIEPRKMKLEQECMLAALTTWTLAA